MPTKADMREPMQPLMFGYTRVSTDKQAYGRNGLEAQRETIDSEAKGRGETAPTVRLQPSGDIRAVAVLAV